MLTIGQRQIGDGQPVFVVAEIGINHGGSRERCAALMDAAAAAGADAVKLQTIDASASYVRGTASYAEFAGKELSDEDLAALMQRAAALGIALFSTPGDFASLDRVTRAAMPAVKISSGLLTNLPLIAEAARRGFPLIMSAGLAYEQEIADAVDTARAHGAPGVALLKCTALYPAADASVNLRAIHTLARRFGVPVGYSDHTLDDLACVGAVAAGATIIEKHFTLDSSLPGADHHLSMEPSPFAAMVRHIRRLEAMRGNAAIQPTPEEERLRAERHRCLVARRDIAAGEAFTAENVALKRPPPGRAGLEPRHYSRLFGLAAARPIREDEPITEACVRDRT
jgi:sialic acid synthase SpsE